MTATSVTTTRPLTFVNNVLCFREPCGKLWMPFVYFFSLAVEFLLTAVFPAIVMVWDLAIFNVDIPVVGQ